MIAWDPNWARAHLWDYLGGGGGGGGGGGANVNKHGGKRSGMF